MTDQVSSPERFFRVYLHILLDNDGSCDSGACLFMKIVVVDEEGSSTRSRPWKIKEFVTVVQRVREKMLPMVLQRYIKLYLTELDNQNDDMIP